MTTPPLTLGAFAIALRGKFGKSNVFMDVDNLFAGQRFDHELDKALSQCDVLIAIVGAKWVELLSRSGGNRDFVRDEIAAALKRNVAVIPVLVGREGRMPTLPEPQDLPEDIRDFVLYQKQGVAHESFGRDTEELIAAINGLLRARRRGWPWIPIAAASAVLLAVVAVSIGYQIGFLSWISPYAGQPRLEPSARSTESEVVGRKTTQGASQDATSEVAQKPSAAQPKLEPEPRVPGVAEQAPTKPENESKRIEQDAARKTEEKRWLVTDCDRLAASPIDATRPDEVKGVELQKIDTNAASAACNDAVRSHPDIARFVYQAGRVAEARNDTDGALRLYRDAIEKGSAAAINRLGLMYENELGGKPDFAEAVRWYEKAASRGQANAMNNLGYAYQNGKGIVRDHAEALKWFERAANLGNTDAMNSLGVYYDDGTFVPKDFIIARKWYEKAAAGGSAASMNNLGALYYLGRGVTTNYAQARKWYEKGAALGNPPAMVSFGLMNESGQGGTRDVSEARMWYEKAEHWAMPRPC